MADKSVAGLYNLNNRYFNADIDCLIIQKDSDKKLYKIPFNILMEAVYPHHDDRVFEWNETHDISLPHTNIYSQDGYDYFDCKIADIDNPGELRDIPEEAKYALIKMSQSSLQVAGPPGWESFESGQTVFLCENMQYPKQRVFDYWDSEMVPDGLSHFNMTPVNHISFRCPAGQRSSQRIWITAWSY